MKLVKKTTLQDFWIPPKLDELEPKSLSSVSKIQNSHIVMPLAKVQISNKSQIIKSQNLKRLEFSIFIFVIYLIFEICILKFLAKKSNNFRN
jgi:ABC-type amino acid transport system permease subunit